MIVPSLLLSFLLNVHCKLIPNVETLFSTKAGYRFIGESKVDFLDFLWSNSNFYLCRNT